MDRPPWIELRERIDENVMSVYKQTIENLDGT